MRLWLLLSALLTAVVLALLTADHVRTVVRREVLNDPDRTVRREPADNPVVVTPPAPPTESAAEAPAEKDEPVAVQPKERKHPRKAVLQTINEGYRQFRALKKMRKAAQEMKPASPGG